MSGQEKPNPCESRRESKQPASHGRLWEQLHSEGRMTAFVRAAILAGCAAWTVFAPISPHVRLHCSILLFIFFAYSTLVTWLIGRFRERSRAIYLGALAADLALLYFLFGETGGAASPFMPAAFLLAVLTAFRYGPVLGVFAACTALGLAIVSDVAALEELHWSEFPLVIIFMILMAAHIGRLAKLEQQERRDIESLHEELLARARDVETAYRQCREAQDHLVHSERLATIGRMSAEMAHQVRNPLSAIGLNMELLEDEMARLHGGSQVEARRLIAAIQKEIDNLADVTESYLRFAQLPPFHWEKCRINSIVQELLFFASPQIEQRGVVVSQRLEKDVPRVRMDRRQFKFAVMNVLGNALEAMGRGGRLRIQTHRNGLMANLIISDTGPGILVEDMKHIFEPFFTTKQSGTGLGLALAQRIVESHGGRITCRSIRQVGTTFTISLPMKHDSGSDGADGDE